MMRAKTKRSIKIDFECHINWFHEIYKADSIKLKTFSELLEFIRLTLESTFLKLLQLKFTQIEVYDMCPFLGTHVQEKLLRKL